MILAFWYLRLGAMRRRGRRVWKWARRHPRWASVVAFGIFWAGMEAAGTTAAAFADSSGPASLPFLPPGSLKDTQGVDLVHYAVLPLDRGDVWTWDKTFWTSIVDTIWMGHITAIGWMLWLFKWLLGFQWVEWIAAPLNVIGTFIQSILGNIGWIPLALTAAAIICALAFFSGRVGKSIVELGISIMCSVLAVGVLANPVASLTGPSGFLNTVEGYGGTIAASIASGDSTLNDQAPSASQASQVLSSTITAQLMDLFVRMPAQEIAFGQNLTGDCDTTFTTQEKAINPVDSSSTSVRDAIHSCTGTSENGQSEGDAAWGYVTNPGPGMVFTALVIQLGSDLLFSLALAVSIVLIMCVGYAIVNAVKLMLTVYAAVAPGVARESLWKSLIGMYVSALCMGLTIVLLSAYLRLIEDVMTKASNANLNIVAQTLIVDLLVIACVISLFVIRHKAHKAGQTVAQRLAQMGFAGRSAPHRPNPVMQTARRVGEHYLAERMRKEPIAGSDNRSINFLAFGSGAGGGAGTGGLPHFTASSMGSPASPGGVAAAKALGMAGGVKGALGAAATIGAAAGTGGASAVVMAMGKVAGKRVMQRAVVSGGQRALRALGPGSSTDAPQAPGTALELGSRAADTAGSAAESAADIPRTAPSTPAAPAQTPAAASEARSFTGFGRQIVVDKDGTGRIAPLEAPESRGVWQITNLVPRQDVANSTLRQRLQEAAGRGGQAVQA